jgi:hypothetical protein
MEDRVALRTYGEHLWTRERARPIRLQAQAQLEALAPGDVLVLETQGVEVFDYSFAEELFGKLVVRLPRDYPGRFLVVEGLSTYTQENLARALESLGLLMIARHDGTLELLGKVHPTDQATFAALVQATGPVTAAELTPRLPVSLNAMNERLAKLTACGVVRRQKGVSPAGREQYAYRVLS